MEEIKKIANEDLSLDLDKDLISIQSTTSSKKADNPIIVVGPGELQLKIPKPFTLGFDEDLFKHLFARQVHGEKESKFEVLYGVYFFQFIYIAKDMLITYSFYYDFVDNVITSKHITEQYYKDVVGLQIVNKYRKLATSKIVQKVKETNTLSDKGKAIYIEDAPTFMLSLSSGERHLVTFVNKDYFLKIINKVNFDIDEDDIEQITLISSSVRNTNNAITALRGRLKAIKA